MSKGSAPYIAHGHAFDMPDLALQLGGGDAHGNRALGLSTVRAIAKRCEEAHNSVSRRKGLNLGCRYVLPSVTRPHIIGGCPPCG